jgi:hypothetical protein
MRVLSLAKRVPHKLQLKSDSHLAGDCHFVFYPNRARSSSARLGSSFLNSGLGF